MALSFSSMTSALATKDSRKMEWEMDKESSFTRKEASTEENGKTTKCKDTAHFIIRMEQSRMRDSGMTISSMELAQFTTIIQLSSKEALTTPISICSMKSGSNTKDSWKKTQKRAKESSTSQTERLTTECSKQTLCTEKERSQRLMDQQLKDNGKKDSWKESSMSEW